MSEDEIRKRIASIRDIAEVNVRNHEIRIITRVINLASPSSVSDDVIASTLVLYNEIHSLTLDEIT